SGSQGVTEASETTSCPGAISMACPDTCSGPNCPAMFSIRPTLVPRLYLSRDPVAVVRPRLRVTRPLAITSCVSALPSRWSAMMTASPLDARTCPSARRVLASELYSMRSAVTVNASPDAGAAGEGPSGAAGPSSAGPGAEGDGGADGAGAIWTGPSGMNDAMAGTAGERASSALAARTRTGDRASEIAAGRLIPPRYQSGAATSG